MKEARLDGAVEVRVDEPFELRLRAEGATGRRWALRAPNEIAEVESRTERAAGFGARPQRYYVFQCKQPGEYRIELMLHRPWEDSGETHYVAVSCQAR